MENKNIINFFTASQTHLDTIIDTNKILGKPLTIEGKTIIPISKLTYGFGIGGSEFISKDQEIIVNDLIKKELPFGGGSFGAVNLNPIGFIVIDENELKIININPQESIFEKMIDLIIYILKKPKEK